MRKQGEHAQTIAIEKLVPFRAHPFVVRDDDQMRLLTESISSMGILRFYKNIQMQTISSRCVKSFQSSKPHMTSR